MSETGDPLRPPDAASARCLGALRRVLASLEHACRHSAADQARVRGLMTDAAATLGASLSALEAAPRTAETPVSDAMRALQFEDIALQVSRAADERLERWCASLGEALAAADPSQTPEALVEAVADALEAAGEASGVHMPADQRTIDEGDAVLF